MSKYTHVKKIVKTLLFPKKSHATKISTINSFMHMCPDFLYEHVKNKYIDHSDLLNNHWL